MWAGGCSIQVAPAVGTNPCLGWLEHKKPSPPWNRQRPWRWVIAFWGVWAEPWGVAGHQLKLSDCFYFHINKTEPKAALS